MRRDSPFVQVYSTNDDTFVHIRQLIYSRYDGEATPSESQDGVMMTLMQFRSLMFHLRALDSQFTQRVETASAVKEEEESTEENDDKTKSVGMKRSWDEREGNVAAANLERVDASGGDVTVVDEIAARAWNELDNILTSFARSDETISDVASVPVKPEPDVDEDDDEPVYNPTPIDRTAPEQTVASQVDPDDVPQIEPSKKVVMTQARVYDELAIVFAEELNDLLLEKVVKDACYG